MKEEDAVLIPKNRGENFSSGFLHSEFWGGRSEPLCRHSTDCCFVSYALDHAATGTGVTTRISTPNPQYRNSACNKISYQGLVKKTPSSCLFTCSPSRTVSHHRRMTLPAMSPPLYLTSLVLFTVLIKSTFSLPIHCVLII